MAPPSVDERYERSGEHVRAIAVSLQSRRPQRASAPRRMGALAHHPRADPVATSTLGRARVAWDSWPGVGRWASCPASLEPAVHRPDLVGGLVVHGRTRTTWPSREGGIATGAAGTPQSPTSVPLSSGPPACAHVARRAWMVSPSRKSTSGSHRRASKGHRPICAPCRGPSVTSFLRCATRLRARRCRPPEAGIRHVKRERCGSAARQRLLSLITCHRASGRYPSQVCGGCCPRREQGTQRTALQPAGPHWPPLACRLRLTRVPGPGCGTVRSAADRACCCPWPSSCGQVGVDVADFAPL